MRNRLCDECGGDVTITAVKGLDCETSQESNMAGYNFQVTVTDADLCFRCLLKLIQKPSELFYKAIDEN